MKILKMTSSSVEVLESDESTRMLSSRIDGAMTQG